MAYRNPPSGLVGGPLISGTWYVYTVRCCDGTLYTGVTTDPQRRLREHNSGRGGAYTRAKRPVKLMFKEARPSRSSALKREAEIKGWSRSRKKQLGSVPKKLNGRET